MIPKWAYLLMVKERARTAPRTLVRQKDLDDIAEREELGRKDRKNELAFPGYGEYSKKKEKDKY